MTCGVIAFGAAAAILPPRHCEEQSDEAIQTVTAVTVWIASRSLSSGRASRTGWLAMTVPNGIAEHARQNRPPVR